MHIAYFLGYVYYFNRQDRDDYFVLNSDNIVPARRRLYGKKCRSCANSTNHVFERPDLESVLHVDYSENA